MAHPVLRTLARDRFVWAFAACFVAELVFSLTPAATPALGEDSGGMLFLLPFLALVTAGALSGLSRIAAPEERRFWRTIALGAAAWLAAASVASVAPGSADSPSLRTIVHALFLFSYLPLLVAVEWRPHHGAPIVSWEPDRWAHVLSASCVALGWFVYFVVVPSFLDPLSSIPAHLLFLILDVMLVGLYFFVGRRCRVPRWRALYWAMGAGSLAGASADLVALLIEARWLVWPSGGTLDLFWAMPSLVYLLAIRSRHAPLGSSEGAETGPQGFTLEERARSGAMALGGAFSFPLIHLWLQPALTISPELRRAQGIVVLVMLGVMGTLAVMTYRLLGRRHRAVVESHENLLHRLREVQRLDAVGRLAGGIAHDFNNMLTGIVGYNDMALQSLPADDPNRPALEQIAHAAGRAARLTQQVLALSRRQILKPERVNLNTIIGQVEPMLTRSVGEDVRLVTSLDPHLHDVWADPTQLQTVVLALAANARDAIPGGGEIDIRTTNVRLSQDSWPADPRRTPGDYVEFSVRDSGPDIPLANQFHQFEPFFAAGGKGRGAGLGLAAVHGIVIQSGGIIEVRSEPGEGAEFVVRLPRSGGSSTPARA